MKLSGKCGLDRTECSPRDLGEASQPGGGEKSGVDGQKSGKRVGIWQNGRGGQGVKRSWEAERLSGSTMENSITSNSCALRQRHMLISRGST